MNNQRSSGDQIIMFVALAAIGWLLFHQFSTAPNQSAQIPPRPALTLAQAFARLDSQNSPNSKPLTEAAALAEKEKLDKAIEAGKEDPYSYWARLRAGLLEQYTLKHSASAIKYYDDIIHHSAGDESNAQAIYQKGDLLWRESTTTGDHQPSQEASQTLEQLVFRGRGSSSEFLDKKIYVPIDPASGTAIPALPVAGFRSVKIRDMSGTLQHPLPNGILERINQYNSTTPYYKVFDKAVNLFGNNPAYSYGLVILCFAICTRILLQPLNKKQYESMKGMQVIAPEMKKIQDKYKGKKDQQDQVKMMKEIQALQRQHGVNPMLGIGLAFAQMPIFFLVVSPFIQHNQPRMELAGASFLWIHSLAGPDIALLIMYSVSMFFSFRLSSVPPTDDTQRQTQMITSVMMPLLFPFFLKNWPSAFTMYWMTFNFISTIFQYRMMKAADPHKSVIKSLLNSPAAAPAIIDESVPARPTKPTPRRGVIIDAAPDANPKSSVKSKAPLNPTPGSALTVGTEQASGVNGWHDEANSLLDEATGDEPLTLQNGLGDGTNNSNGKSGADGTAQRGNSNTQRTRRRRRY